MRATLLLILALGLCPCAARAAEVSTHVLDLARGTGGVGVPVTLSRRGADGRWQEAARTRTDDAGRVRSFGAAGNVPPGDYRLHFDFTSYPDAKGAPFFPEIDITFRVTEAAGHYHVPVVLSPYGYSTYRGN